MEDKNVYPCTQCVHERNKDCTYKGGCGRWKAWFRAYWDKLRRKYL